MLRCDSYDNAVRWKPGERLHHLFEERCDRHLTAGKPWHLALDNGLERVSFAELDARANRMARQLLALGVGPGTRIGLVVDKSVVGYVGLLAILKANAAYVPMDASFPLDRIAYICKDAGITGLLTVYGLADKFAGFEVCPVGVLQEIEAAAADLPAHRLTADETGPAEDQLAYIIYTSGSTGNPKGVAIEHASICNFVRVAADVYGLQPSDRVYQGMTLAFDFSVEELWVPLIAGATLVPARSDTTLVGQDLANFLIAREVTGLACVPTLLATIDADLPKLRFLLVSGEACPYDLVVRWHRPGRRMLNAYGPTEATVTCSWTELHPEKPVTIGIPLPTYTMMILSPDATSELPNGEIGEIGVAGIGLALGYVNRDDLTAAAFVPDQLGIADNPSGRIYKTGDLGRINAAGEIEYHGRIDTQVKVRGYRIELTEIESKILEYPGVAQAVVRTYTPPGGGAPELAAYVTLKPGIASIDAKDIAKHLRGRLPGYMIPAYIEEIDDIPMLPSHKADRKKLPDPSRGRVMSGSSDFVAPRTPTEAAVAQALAATLGVDQVSIGDHFFDDLGANSLTMARFVAKLQALLPGKSVAIADAYRNPTTTRLAEVIEADTTPAFRHEAPPLVRPSRIAHTLCGFGQYLFYVAIGFLYLVIGIEAYRWQYDAADFQTLYQRAVVSTSATMLVAIALPIVAKWLLIGRWRETTFPIWSFKYYRFWVVKQLIQTNPLVLFKGQPIFNWYLRLLGARIGRHAVVSPRVSPLATDLLSIGEGAVLAKDTLFQGYTAERGLIHIGRVNVGRNVYVGEGSILEIGSSIGDDAQVAHVASLQRGQSVPAGARYHGSPAVPTTGDFVPVEPRRCGTVRRWVFSTAIVAGIIGILLPALDMLAVLTAQTFTDWVVLDGEEDLEEVATLLGFSLTAFLASLGIGLMIVAIVPRLLGLFLRTGKTYPLFGFHYAVAMTASWFSNSTLYNVIFGDSSFITGYQKWAGYDLGDVKQSGSNFGSYQKHDLAKLSRVGTGTLVSDGLSLISVRQSNSSFKLERAEIPDQSFLGNHIVYVAGARLGPGNLLATKVMVPLDGPMRADVGLLGSPPFEIPRQVVTERSFDATAVSPEQQRRLAAKDRHNILTMIYYLGLMWVFSVLTIGFSKLVFNYYDDYGTLALLAAAAAAPLITVAYFVVIEAFGPGRMRLEPKNCTIHEPHFWKIERYWKMGETPLRQAFKGTPFRPMIYRWQGVHMGRMVFDDGCAITEKALTHIGDYACLNEATSLQCHSLEDGLFKSDHIRLGEGATLAPAAFINYGASMGEGAILLADSFLMKGSQVADGDIWVGNPARRAS